VDKTYLRRFVVWGELLRASTSYDIGVERLGASIRRHWQPLAMCLLAALFAAGAEPVRYDLHGRLIPAARASVWLQGATSPFEDITLADDAGHFRFRALLAGTYTLGVFVPGRGELRETIEVGPSQAHSKGRIDLPVDLRNALFESHDSLRRSALVSARELAIPDKARREFANAEKSLGHRDVQSATAHLERAVQLAPGFAEAWNHLGTIAYQSREYARAETCFRRALEANPNAYEPLVNLGGVLLNLRRFEEALEYNRHAVLTHPHDALANSQLGMTYFGLNELDLSRKYLDIAIGIDPAHFSHPQLVLAAIDIRRYQPAAAVNELRQFLKYHPDSPEAPGIKEKIAQLEKPPAPPAQTAAAPPGPAAAYASTGMARSFSETPELAPLSDYAAPSGRHFSVLSKQGHYYLESRDAEDKVRETPIDAVLGSGLHARVLLTRAADGRWMELPIAWYTLESGRYGMSPGFEAPARTEFSRPVSAECLSCHTSQSSGHTTAIGCERCHSSASQPNQAVCLQCHLPSSAPNPGHGATPAGDDPFELNSAAYRLFQSRCYQNSPGKLTCATCHPPHSFSRTLAEYRQVCRSCHPAMHNGAALNCTRCHMPKRRAQDAIEMWVTDHRIQRPL
jgi:tetratricopeptide (TPR) repeat protein